MPESMISFPEPFKPIAKTLWSGDRKYQCGVCGWITPWVHDGEELRGHVETHRKECPACFQSPVG